MEIPHPQQPGNGPVAIKASLEVAVHQGSALHPGESSLCAGCWDWTAAFSEPEKSGKIYYHLVAENEHVIQEFFITQ